MLAAVAALGWLSVAALALLDFFLYMVEYAADQSGKKRPQQEVVILIRNPFNLPDFGKMFFNQIVKRQAELQRPIIPKSLCCKLKFIVPNVNAVRYLLDPIRRI